MAEALPLRRAARKRATRNPKPKKRQYEPEDEERYPILGPGDEMKADE